MPYVCNKNISKLVGCVTLGAALAAAASGARADSLFADPVTYEVGAGARSVAIGDLDGDGARDVAVASFTTSSLYVTMNDGQGALSTPILIGDGMSPGNLHDVAIGDVNGDGFVNVLDLIELLLAFGTSCP